MCRYEVYNICSKAQVIFQDTAASRTVKVKQNYFIIQNLPIIFLLLQTALSIYPASVALPFVLPRSIDQCKRPHPNDRIRVGKYAATKKE